MDSLLPEQPKTTASRRHWSSTHLRAALLGAQDSDRAENGSKCVDLSVSQCRVTARVHDSLGKQRRVEVIFRRIPAETVEMLAEALAAQAFFLAKLLCHELPQEIEEVARLLRISLIPTTHDFECRIEGRVHESSAPLVSTLLSRLCERVDDDPFLVLQLRGITREELIARIREHRDSLRRQLHRTPVRAADESKAAEPENTSLRRYFTPGDAIFSLSYHIRADEIPAALLKWLDMLPLGGLEDEVEFLLEEAYEVVTRRAQVLGLGL